MEIGSAKCERVWCYRNNVSREKERDVELGKDGERVE